jgi:hypothetical protein
MIDNLTGDTSSGWKRLPFSNHFVPKKRTTDNLKELSVIH